LRSPLSQREVKFLREMRVARLATASKECEPHVVPVFFVYQSGVLWTTAGSKTRKLKNLRENDKVTVVIDEYVREPPRERGVLLRGRAEIFSDGKDYEKGIETLTRKYQGYDPRESSPSEGAPRVIKVITTRVVRWGFGED